MTERGDDDMTPEAIAARVDSITAWKAARDADGDLTQDPRYNPRADYGDGFHDYYECGCKRCVALRIDAEFWH